MKLSALLALAVAQSATAASYKYVVAFSVDGLHGSDIQKYLNVRPKSTFASLLETGYEYTNAFTSAPSDSFPGAVAQFTGASPRTTGVWYDDTYDRTFYAPDSNCTGPPGAEVTYDESKDYNSTLLWSGGLDPANLPQKKQNGKCVQVAPHKRLRVNTVFEIARAAGLETAYTDKHPAYDIVRGPSGTGLTVGYFPEIAAVPVDVNATIAYDQLHVNAWLDWIDGITPVNTTTYGPSLTANKAPSLFGGNFQAVSVAQKAVGYNNDSTSSMSAPILQAMDFVDSSIGKVVAKLKAKSLLSQTLIIIASKHGQAPIKRSLWSIVDPAALMNSTGVPTAFITTDDIGLVFLNNSADTAKCVQNLQANASLLHIAELIYGANLTAQGFGNPATDPSVPNIIVRPTLGTCYTTSTAKVAEHGGLSVDDRHVACLVSNPGLKKKSFSSTVSTRQVAVTMLKALGLDPKKLQGAVMEGTVALPGF